MLLEYIFCTYFIYCLDYSIYAVIQLPMIGFADIFYTYIL